MTTDWVIPSIIIAYALMATTLVCIAIWRAP